MWPGQVVIETGKKTKTVPYVLDTVVSSGGATGLAVCLMHGASGSLDSPTLAALAAALSHSGVPCLRYTSRGSNLQHRVTVCKAMLEQACTMAGLEGTRRWVLGGHSMGARVACQVAADVPQLVAGCIGLSYPLHPPSQPTQLRDELLAGVQQPLLLIRGTRDPFSQQHLWDAVLPRLCSSALTVHAIEGGDHSLKVAAGKASETATAAALANVCSWVLQFLQGLPAQQEVAAATGQAPGPAAATEDNTGAASRTKKRAAAGRGAAAAKRGGNKPAPTARKRKQVNTAPAAGASNGSEKGTKRRW